MPKRIFLKRSAEGQKQLPKMSSCLNFVFTGLNTACSLMVQTNQKTENNFRPNYLRQRTLMLDLVPKCIFSTF